MKFLIHCFFGSDQFSSCLLERSMEETVRTLLQNQDSLEGPKVDPLDLMKAYKVPDGPPGSTLHVYTQPTNYTTKHFQTVAVQTPKYKLSQQVSRRADPQVSTFRQQNYS